MANLLIKIDGTEGGPTSEHEAVTPIKAGPKENIWVLGEKGTFSLVRQGEDLIVAIGYVCYISGKSTQETLAQILASFRESQIGELKKQLVGQFVLFLKKNGKLYLFSDFMGARNIFYSENGMVISSSFSVVEDLLNTGPSDLDMYKVLEYLAVKHLLYPAWLGRSTMHKRIRYLLPYEYLVIDPISQSYRVGSITYSIDNKKTSDRAALSSELLSALRAIVVRPEFVDSLVAASLSGGRDSRLVAAIASEYYHKIGFRIAVAPGHFDSLKDLKVAKKLALVRNVPLEVYWFQPGRDEERFRALTEGFSPIFNNKLAPLLDGAGSYALGFGGVFGTELFMPIPWNSIEDFIQGRIAGAKRALKVEEGFWSSFREAIVDEFERIKVHYQLSDSDDRDYIRLFDLIDTARYGSFIISAFNCLGYQLEPYGSYPILDLALRVAPSLWGTHRGFSGDARVQQAAMAKLNSQMARVLTYKNYRPMMPLSMRTFPLYVMGATLQAGELLRSRSRHRFIENTRTQLPGGHYISDGWEKPFLNRTMEKYGLASEFSFSANGTQTK